MDMTTLDTEFLRPLVAAWTAKIEAAEQCRSDWKEVSDECVMFYNKSAAAMWKPDYTRKAWRGVKAPRFRFSMNKAYEYVAITLPNLLWEVPHRNVAPKSRFELPQGLDLADPQLAMMVEQFLPMQQQKEYRDKVTAMLLQDWLNYTPNESNLLDESESATVNALLRGRGCLVSRIFNKPDSNVTLTGSFNLDPCDLLTDPGSKTFNDSKYIIIRHTEYHWEVERRFKLEPNSMRGRATLESLWRSSELKTDSASQSMRAAGLTNDIVVWYEIYSYMGPGCRSTDMDSQIRDHLEETVGDHAYIAICPSCPWPLNCPSEQMRKGISSDEVKRRFSWPVPLYKDNRWPVVPLDFYKDPDSSWPVPPLAPALGELKLLNFLLPWATNRVWSSSRDFWAIAQQHIEEYRSYILEGEDQCIIPTPVGVDDVNKAVKILTQPESRQDIWRIIDFAETMFEKRTGMTETAFGRNEDGTQNRTAEETLAKNRAVGVRPEYLAKKVVGWMGEVACNEANLVRAFVSGDDYARRCGPIGKLLWEQFVSSQDAEAISLQMEFTIAASSIRRPNRDRDLGNLTQVMQTFVPPSLQYGWTTGSFDSYNWFVKKWGEYHDMDMSEAMLRPLPALQPLPPQPAEEPEKEGKEETEKEEAPTQQPPQPQPMMMPMEQMPMEQQLPPELMMQLAQLQQPGIVMP